MGGLDAVHRSRINRKHERISAEIERRNREDLERSTRYVPLEYGIEPEPHSGSDYDDGHGHHDPDYVLSLTTRAKQPDSITLELPRNYLRSPVDCDS